MLKRQGILTKYLSSIGTCFCNKKKTTDLTEKLLTTEQVLVKKSEEADKENFIQDKDNLSNLTKPLSMTSEKFEDEVIEKKSFLMNSGCKSCESKSQRKTETEQTKYANSIQGYIIFKVDKKDNQFMKVLAQFKIVKLEIFDIANEQHIENPNYKYYIAANLKSFIKISTYNHLFHYCLAYIESTYPYLKCQIKINPNMLEGELWDNYKEIRDSTVIPTDKHCLGLVAIYFEFRVNIYSFVCNEGEEENFLRENAFDLKKLTFMYSVVIPPKHRQIVHEKIFRNSDVDISESIPLIDCLAMLFTSN